ncbi:Rieske 2Fe-2S domain-containing protein [Jatrophihabitans cynanchi]|uniref:Rieske 2Fe-2S domain-containing protein n=1 Tax=Jatrophihabitans cynanchi TaxID=2944128 RepID=A0ABY7JWU6_9ACTN|nr:Rieske 2Fe-2S domain-containing protein [Jatrophihabitans sp. SB3-54]WAX56465.1 Rieske 2Fe-2S domain-containing protein [Jatrophihabitans sp. SB3-54]
MVHSTAAARAARLADEVAGLIENAAALDGPAARIRQLADRVLPGGATRDIASGVPLGHPLHPVLVALPIGSWTAASYLDLTGGDRTAARRLVALGIATAVPAAVTGVNDWLSTADAERRVGLVHAALNHAALIAYGASWIARRHGRHAKGVLLSLAGLVLTSGAGWLGGHLAFALGVGVDTTAFQQLPSEWTDAADESDLTEGAPICAEVGGVPVLLLRTTNGASTDTTNGVSTGGIIAMADRCTHRGGALHEGEVRDGCITCPLHGSRFASDGSVQRGPATRPQPTLQVRVTGGRIQVRRPHEPRALRNNPVGS